MLWVVCVFDYCVTVCVYTMTHTAYNCVTLLASVTVTVTARHVTVTVTVTVCVSVHSQPHREDGSETACF